MAGAIAGTAILNCPFNEGLHTVTLTINNECNLSCPHCYLQYEGDRPFMDEGVLSTILEGQFSHLAIVGKEPLLSADSVALCERIAQLCVLSNKSLSLITNGLGLRLLGPELLSALSYIDISFDGGPESYQLYRKGSLMKIVSGLEHLRARGFSRVNALHVLNDRTIGSVSDMMRVVEWADFEHVMFSPYITTSNYGSNGVRELSLESIIQALSQSNSFMNEPRAFLLVDVFNLSTEAAGRTDVDAIVNRYGVQDKVSFVSADPLLFGIIRVTYDGLVLSPEESIHPRNYQSRGFDLRKCDLESAALENIYERLLLQHQARNAYDN